MPQALQLVREDLGSEAVILDSRKIGGRGDRTQPRTPVSVEVTAGLEEVVAPGEHPSPRPTPGRSGRYQQRDTVARTGMNIHTPALFAGGAASLSGQADAAIHPGNAGGLPGNALESALESARRVAREFAPALDSMGSPAVPDELEPPQDYERSLSGEPNNRVLSSLGTERRQVFHQQPDSVAHQLQKLQETVSKIARQAPAQFLLPGEVSHMADRLRAGGLSEPLVCQCIHMVYSELEGRALDDRDTVNALAAKKIAELLPERRDIRVSSKRRNVIGFVGLSGSGKTTAAAKIAAGFATRQTRAIGDDPRRILMITTDNRRLGAVDQLRSLAQITGISHAVAHTEEEMRAALKDHISARLVLIDTAGCGPHEQGERERQKRLLEAAGADEVQVVIDGLITYEHMLDVIESSRVLSSTLRLLFTKMDEAVRRGAAVSAAAHSGIPTSYFSVGPAFPGGLKPGDLGRLVGELLGMSTKSAKSR